MFKSKQPNYFQIVQKKIVCKYTYLQKERKRKTIK